jgi:hypothetical protein
MIYICYDCKKEFTVSTSDELQGIFCSNKCRENTLTVHPFILFPKIQIKVSTAVV